MDLLISDGGSEFKNEVTNVCNTLAIQQKYTAAHRAIIRQGPSGPAFRTRAGGALGTTGHTRSQ